MKKLALATMLASVSTLATANSGLYIQGDVGYSKLQYADEKVNNKVRDNGVKATIAVGKDAGDIRYQADVTQYNDASGRLIIVNGEEQEIAYLSTNSQGEIETGTTTGKVFRKDIDVKAVQSVGVSAIYDFETTNPMITPYAGARLGMNRIKTRTRTHVAANITREVPSIDPNNPGTTTETVQRIFVDEKSKQKDKLGLGVSAGVQFHINDKFAVDTGVEYNHLGKVDGVKGDQFGAKVGARMNF